MIARVLWFDLATVLFFENPKIRQHLHAIFKRGTKSTHIHNLKTKTLFKDMETSYTFCSQQLASRCFICIFAGCSLRSRVRTLAVLLLLENITRLLLLFSAAIC